VAITGARPLGVTNCLNFGDPTDAEAFWRFAESVRGLGDACRALGLPVTGGNVSFYNAAASGSILPTAQIGIVGLLDDVERRVSPAFRQEGDLIVLIGEASPGLAGSAYAALAGAAPDDGPPALDLAREAALQGWLLAAARGDLLASAQDVSGGGLAVALAECAIWSGLGARLQVAIGSTPSVDLFGESPGRVVVTVEPASWEALLASARSFDLPIRRLGLVGGQRLTIDLVGDRATGAAEERGAGVADALDVDLQELGHTWRSALPRALGEVA
jgi:phosphoribosylformylglycinamidine synthase